MSDRVACPRRLIYIFSSRATATAASTFLRWLSWDSMYSLTRVVISASSASSNSSAARSDGRWLIEAKNSLMRARSRSCRLPSALATANRPRAIASASTSLTSTSGKSSFIVRLLSCVACSSPVAAQDLELGHAALERLHRHPGVLLRQHAPARRLEHGEELHVLQHLDVVRREIVGDRLLEVADGDDAVLPALLGGQVVGQERHRLDVGVGVADD